MTITKQNRADFIGITVDCVRRLHHNYDDVIYYDAVVSAERSDT